MDKQVDCAICFESLDNVDPIDIRDLDPCDHKFHEDCIAEWERTNETCPLCRRDMYGPSPQTEKLFNEITAKVNELWNDPFEMAHRLICVGFPPRIWVRLQNYFPEKVWEISSIYALVLGNLLSGLDNQNLSRKQLLDIITADYVKKLTIKCVCIAYSYSDILDSPLIDDE